MGERTTTDRDRGKERERREVDNRENLLEIASFILSPFRWEGRRRCRSKQKGFIENTKAQFINIYIEQKERVFDPCSKSSALPSRFK